jgi:transcriptional regulator with XRE-family HTH domain
MRVGLKAAIMARGFTQRQFSRLSNIPENRVSELIRGWTDPTEAERSLLGKLLDQPADALFDTNVRIELRSHGG